MAKIEIKDFKGILPKLAKDNLPDRYAQIAQNCRVASHNLEATKRSSQDSVLTGSSYKTLFIYDEGANTHWVYYDDIVHWVRSPIGNDTYERMYFTGVSNEYRAFANDILSTPFDFTTDYYKPGAPSGAAPTLSVAAGANYRAYFFTYVSRYGEEGPASGVVENSAVDTTARVEVNDITYPTSYSHLIPQTGLGKPHVNIYRTATDGAASSAFLFVCQASWFEATEDYAVGDWVLYNGGSGTLYALYECTAAHSAAAWNGAHFTKGELVADADLGSTCDSIDYDEATSGIENLRAHPNGFFVASKDNILYFTEPYAPWGWPSDYQIAIDQTIIGLAVHNSTIIVLSDGNIYSFTGPHPTTLHRVKRDFQPCLSQQGIVETEDGAVFPSAEGFIRVNAGGVTNITAELFKPDDWADYELETMRGTWYNKAYYGFYSTADNTGFIIIDLLNGVISTGPQKHHCGYVSITDGTFRTITAAKIGSGDLYIAQWNNDSNSYLNYKFKSKEYVFQKPLNLKVAQVMIDEDFYDDVLSIISDNSYLTDLNNAAWSSDLLGSLNSHAVNGQDINGDTLYTLISLGVQEYVVFRLYVEGVLKFTKQVSDSKVFKLPSGYKGKKLNIELEGMIPVQQVVLATSTEEIV